MVWNPLCIVAVRSWRIGGGEGTVIRKFEEGNTKKEVLFICGNATINGRMTVLKLLFFSLDAVDRTHNAALYNQTDSPAAPRSVPC